MPTAVGVGIENVITEYRGSPVLRRGKLFWLCPFHEDQTFSLTIFPERRRWRCMQCNACGDAIDFVRKLRTRRFWEAVSTLKALGIRIATERKKVRKHAKAPVGSELPPKSWRDDASRVVNACVRALDDPNASEVRQWLQDRGLNPETLRRWKIGYHPTARKHDGLWVPSGITIPWTYRGHVTAIKVLRSDLDFHYQWVRGGERVGLYLGETVRPGLPTLLVASEPEVLMVGQELGDLVNVATFGSSWDGPDEEAMKLLSDSPAILISYGLDPYGKLANWRKLESKIRHCPLPDGLSMIEFKKQGSDIRTWIEERLAGC